MSKLSEVHSPGSGYEKVLLDVFNFVFVHFSPGGPSSLSLPSLRALHRVVNAASVKQGNELTTHCTAQGIFGGHIVFQRLFIYPLSRNDTCIGSKIAITDK